MIIYNKSFPSSPYKSEGIPGALFAKSANGYMDEELFYTWFSQLFVPRTAHLRKRILFIDGHGSHISLRLIDLAKESNVILFCLPPHTTHLLQPLDVAVFSPLKNHFSKITDFVQIISATSNELTTVYVNKANFHLIFKEAFNRTMSIATVIAGFRKTGIYPFNKTAVKVNSPSLGRSFDLSPHHTATEPISNHPLTALANIPAHLAEILLTPDNVSKRSTRMIVTERVLTDEEWRKKIEEKENEESRKEEEKRKKKTVREEKKRLSEEMKRKKEEDKIKEKERKKKEREEKQLGKENKKKKNRKKEKITRQSQENTH